MAELRDPPESARDQSKSSDERTIISDDQFIERLTYLRKLRSLLLQESGRINDETVLEFGTLELLRSPNPASEEHGRLPTEREWSEVQRHTQVLFNLLTPSLRGRLEQIIQAEASQGVAEPRTAEPRTAEPRAAEAQAAEAQAAETRAAETRAAAAQALRVVDNTIINDETFMKDLKRLKDLRSS